MKTEQEFIGHPLPVYIIEKDFSTGEYIIWNTEELREEFRGTREQADTHSLTL
ncbi:MAG: hypothetical protein WKF87_06600 [Chryseolinea sp.]